VLMSGVGSNWFVVLFPLTQPMATPLVTSRVGVATHLRGRSTRVS
jgi:hypothetical protein